MSRMIATLRRRARNLVKIDGICAKFIKTSYSKVLDHILPGRAPRTHHAEFVGASPAVPIPFDGQLAFRADTGVTTRILEAT